MHGEHTARKRSEAARKGAETRAAQKHARVQWEARQDEPSVRQVTLMLCELCLEGAGGECHTPGCSLWMTRAPDIPIALDPPLDDQVEVDRLRAELHAERVAHAEDGERMTAQRQRVERVARDLRAAREAPDAV